MNAVTQKAYAKINLGLDVLRRRADGYHEVQMIMQTLDIYDELELAIQEEEITVSTDNMELPVDKNNLVYQAAALMKQRFQLEKGVSIHLKKRIPIAAGMAGGSADAAAVFRGMNELFDLGASPETLQSLGVKVGADVPYCILGGTVLCEGIGEVLTTLPSAPACKVLVAKPRISVSTKYVYEHLGADTLTAHPDIPGMAEAIRQGSLDGVVERLGNVLETVTQNQYPVIRQLKETMLFTGALGALMSGSGPTVFGLYQTQEEARQGYEIIRKSGMAEALFVTEFV